MRSFFLGLTAVLVIITFLGWPIAFAFAPITLLLAIFSAPSGVRPDGKAKTGGLLGFLWDDVVIHNKMQKCTYCKTWIDKQATKCAHCGEWVPAPAPPAHRSMRLSDYRHIEVPPVPTNRQPHSESAKSEQS